MSETTDYNDYTEEHFLFDVNWVTDTTVKDIVNREQVSEQLRALDREIVLQCKQLGIDSDSIPVDDYGHITSPVLISYAKFWLYHTLLSDYWYHKDDIYESKLSYYTKQMGDYHTKLSVESILNTSNLRSLNIQQKVIW